MHIWAALTIEKGRKRGKKKGLKLVEACEKETWEEGVGPNMMQYVIFVNEINKEQIKM